MSESVQEVLLRVNSKFYHATQLIDFKSYCAQSAVLSRSELQKSGSAYTPFYTDDSDQAKGLWGRVFGNIEDFGRLFWNPPAGVPNAYGPITLVFNPPVWTHLEDVSVTERGAHNADFDLAEDSMRPAEVAGCFKEVDGRIRQVQWGLEVSSSSPRLSFAHLAYVLVEPLTPDFRDIVSGAASGCLPSSRIIERTRYGETLKEAKVETLRHLVDWSRQLEGKLPPANELTDIVPVNLREWFDEVRRTQHGPLRQWLEYTYNGTLQLPELNASDREAELP